MKVLVAVAEVADVEDEFAIDGLAIDEQYLNYDLNEWDDYAVEAGVQLQEAGEDVEVVSVTIGPERADETIRMALAKGVDRSIRVWDENLEGTEYLDSETKADVLAAVVEDEQPDLVLAGVQSDDTAFGATGVALAEEVGFEWAAVVNDLEYEPGSETASVHRELEGGVEEFTDVELPAVFTIQTGINEPRYASLRGIRQAQSKEIAPKTLDELGLDASVTDSDVSLTQLYEPETESDATLFEGSPDEEADQLAELLRDEGVEA
ncbi:electron transfer flavoprotein subunit beta/FixA family protein [Halococcus dombrowskii]|uniref:Electron transfer flavoprotein subunit beta/FixA family protein n=1 Tax=Halococcus dombrowskii TaxID=179637 RepID=A0AAV3SAY0_HALDO|nr:electron transfer flavoprotein subunit beta/FixA family protein [Halococcus dombrowskii]UOO94319.1 electron transfer flavoprotein subunit beta/FixA family protein [Halococcus dombrowskii]